MADFRFFTIPGTRSWVISDPKRGDRPHDEKKDDCPFCSKEIEKEIIYDLQSGEDQIRVAENKFPFARHHEVIIHSKKHTHNIFDLHQDTIVQIIQVWKTRFVTHKDQGTVCIFSNSGEEAGESIAHSHSQLAVLPEEIIINFPKLEDEFEKKEIFEIGDFEIVCPAYAQWPDEVWIVPKKRGKLFYEIEDGQIKELSFVLKRVLFLLSLRHGHAFPHNYAIYPYRDWYLRIIPRAKIIGGLEVSTGVMVNTQDPQETINFLREHFFEEDEALIKEKKALYKRTI